MAMQQLTLPGEIVKKHNKLVRGKINIDSVLGSRVLATLVACVRFHENDFNLVYSVPIKDFITDAGGKSYTEIKNACRELAKATAEIEEPDPDSPHSYFQVYTFFSSIKYRKGIVTARFNDEMIPLLYILQTHFTKYNLLEYLQLPSIYSQRMFEILKSWGNLPEITLTVTELHEKLKTPASFRADFRQFRTRVLEKAHKDIQGKTTLRYEWEPMKVGRSVVSIRFLFAPGRKAIAEAESKKTDQTKQSQRANQRFLRAVECAKTKSGLCAKQDNKPSVCKLCAEQGFCDDILRQRGKPGPVPVGLGLQHSLTALGKPENNALDL